MFHDTISFYLGLCGGEAHRLYVEVNLWVMQVSFVQEIKRIEPCEMLFGYGKDPTVWNILYLVTILEIYLSIFQLTFERQVILL